MVILEVLYSMPIESVLQEAPSFWNEQYSASDRTYASITEILSAGVPASRMTAAGDGDAIGRQIGGLQDGVKHTNLIMCELSTDFMHIKKCIINIFLLYYILEVIIHNILY